MTRKYKVGDKVWLKAVVADPPRCDERIWLTVSGWSIWTTTTNIRPCVKRKRATSPWQPIETAPKDGTPIFIRRINTEGRIEYRHAAFLNTMAITPEGRVVQNPTHWMPIPPLEVEG